MNKKQYVYWSIIFIVFSIYAVILAYYCYKNTLCYPYLSDSYRSFFDIFVLKDNSSFGYILSNLFEIDSIINILPLYPFSLIFKGHYFFFFIIGNLFLYTIPLIGILLFTVFTKIINWRENKIFNVFIITSILFMPQLYLNTFLGLSEISNLILIFLLIYKTYNIDFSKKLPVKNMILLGLTLYAIFFLRRFYCVFDISYIIAIILINIPRIINSKELEKSKLFFNLLKNILIVGFAFTFFFLVFNFKYVISSLSVGNSVYEAYNCGVIDNLIKIVHSIGILQISLLIISIILIIIRIIYKKEDNQYIKFLFVIFLFYSILMCL